MHRERHVTQSQDPLQHVVRRRRSSPQYVTFLGLHETGVSHGSNVLPPSRERDFATRYPWQRMVDTRRRLQTLVGPPYRAQDTLTLKECAPASDVQESVPASSLLITRPG